MQLLSDLSLNFDLILHILYRNTILLSRGYNAINITKERLNFWPTLLHSTRHRRWRLKLNMTTNSQNITRVILLHKYALYNMHEQNENPQ